MKYYLAFVAHGVMCGNISLKLFAELLTRLADADFANEYAEYYKNKIIQEILSADIEDGENEDEKENLLLFYYINFYGVSGMRDKF